MLGQAQVRHAAPDLIVADPVAHDQESRERRLAQDLPRGLEEDVVALGAANVGDQADQGFPGPEP